MKRHVTTSALRAALVAACLWAGATSAQTTLFSCDFDSMNVGYGTGTITTGTEAHDESATYSTWQWWPDASQNTLVSMQSTYFALIQYHFGSAFSFRNLMRQHLDTAISSANNGFMMMSLFDQRTRYSGNFNAYILFCGIDASSTPFLEVQFYQYYSKYYDYCYIDYSVDNTTWAEMEINTSGVDVDVNGSMHGFATYSLPVAAAGCGNLCLRLRYKSLNSARDIYGYFWIVDDFSVHAATTNRIRTFGDTYVEGNYRTLPQGLSVNPAWYALVQNNGASDHNNLNVTINHLDSTQTASGIVATNSFDSLPIGAWGHLLCDPAGWLSDTDFNTLGWYGYSNPSTPHGTGTTLPTGTVGDHYLYAHLTDSLSGISHNYDTTYYRVVAADSNNIYTWARDNGVLTYSPHNSWIYGFIERDGNWYIGFTNEVQYYIPGYTVTSRYTTGNTVPYNWCILGVEIVASPVEGLHTVGAQLAPELWKDVYERENVSFEEIRTGAGIHTVTADEVNDSTVIGRNSHGYREPGQYNTIRILFPNQPPLTANTVYRIGYRLTNYSSFAVARANQPLYYQASSSTTGSGDTILYFRDNDSTAKYGIPYTGNRYDSYVRDPFYGLYGPTGISGTFTWHYEIAPMIRMLVGPGRPRLTVESNDTLMGSATGSGLYDEGDTVILHAIANPGYHFSHWQDGDTTNPRILIFSLTDSIYTAYFEEDLSVQIYGPTAMTVGDTVSFHAISNYANATIAWQLQGATPSTATGDTVTATWATVGTYRVIATATERHYSANDTLLFTVHHTPVFFLCTGTGSGEVQRVDRQHNLCGDTDYVALGSVAYYDFTPNRSDYLAHIYVDGVERIDEATQLDSTYRLALTIEENLTVNAVFNARVCQINARSKDTLFGIVTGGGTYRIGDTAILTAIPHRGYHFDRWQDYNTDNPRQVIVVSGATYIAYFAEGEGIDAIDGLTLTLYPNPASDEVSIGLSGLDSHVRITVLDASGRQVLARDLECQGDCTTLLPLSHLSQGVYFVRVVNAESLATVRKLIVK